MTDPIFDLVIADLRQREAQGAETYGKARMMAGDGRDSLRDAYEEALDLAVYLRKAIAERYALRAAVDAYAAQNTGKSLEEALAEVGEDEPA